MPSAKQPKRGGLQPYQARYRISTGPCTGLDLSEDVSTIADSALVDAINGRVHDGIVVSRGGQTTLADSMNGCVQGLVDVEGSGPRAIVLADSNLHLFDHSAGPTDADKMQQIPWEGGPSLIPTGFDDYVNTGRRYAFFWWNGQIMMITGGQWKKIVLPEKGNNARDIVVEDFLDLQVPGEASVFTVQSMVTFPPIGDADDGGPVYFATDDGGVVGFVSGQFVRLLPAATFTDGHLIAFRLDDTLVVAGGDGKVMWMEGWSQGLDAASGSWRTLNYPSGTPPNGVSTFYPMCGIGFQGKGYIGGFDDDITHVWNTPPYKGILMEVQFSGGQLVFNTIHQGATPGGPAKNINSFDDLIIHQGKLHYMYRTKDQFELGFIGTYDGTDFSCCAYSLGGENGANHARMQSSDSAIAYGYHGSEVLPTFEYSFSGGGFNSIDMDALFSHSNPPKDMIFF